VRLFFVAACALAVRKNAANATNRPVRRENLFIVLGMLD
jgi:hypothetical protein